MLKQQVATNSHSINGGWVTNSHSINGGWATNSHSINGGWVSNLEITLNAKTFFIFFTSCSSLVAEVTSGIVKADRHVCWLAISLYLLNYKPHERLLQQLLYAVYKLLL
jgi:hypothetical protein